MNNLKDIHNHWTTPLTALGLFYQDFNEQFEGYTQLHKSCTSEGKRCFIRISMNNLKDIHNSPYMLGTKLSLFYQDFNEQFEGYTQLFRMTSVPSARCFIRISMNNSAAKVQKK